MATEDPDLHLLSKRRVETFSDGIIAIAITLSVLSIDIPHRLPNSRVGSGIVHLIPDVLNYLLSFAVIGMFWIGHHYVLDRIDRVDRRLLLLNLGFLACISLMPLVTRLLNEYAEASPAVITYATVMTLASLSELGTWRHALRRGLVSERVGAAQRRSRTFRIASMAAIFAASIPVALLSPAVGQLMWALILFRASLERVTARRA